MPIGPLRILGRSRGPDCPSAGRRADVPKTASAARKNREKVERSRRPSTAQPEAPDQRLVAARIRALEVIEQAPPLPHHNEQAAPRVKVLLVRAEMVGEVADALGQNCDLHLGRARIVGFRGVFLDERLLALGCDRHRPGVLQQLMTRSGRRPPFSTLASATTCESQWAPTTVPSSSWLIRAVPAGVEGRTRCPWRNRAASAAVRAKAGMSSSAVSIGSRCPEAARLCRSEASESREIARASVNGPTESRRSPATRPTVP